ncbi:MAG TPA: molybdenum cofactor guanylyltransferase [Terriglobales bacterium]|nr:molybdenum cofactor guanylyltransferase [Terriglobales bacterium]
MTETSAFVLTGGQSLRMGTDKAFVKLGGRSLLERVLALAEAVSPSVYIVGSRQKFARLGSVVEDVFVGHGPLGGIHAALRSSRTEMNLILAVDMPFVEVQFLRHLLESAVAHPAAVVTAPRTRDGWQPLCAVYRRSFADLAEAALAHGKNKIDTLFAHIEVFTVGERELAKEGWSPAMLRNLNTPEEVDAAQR